jgi:hypothetical protein
MDFLKQPIDQLCEDLDALNQDWRNIEGSDYLNTAFT